MALQLTTSRAPLNAVQRDESGLPWCLVLQPFGGKAVDCATDDEYDVFADDIARCDSCYGYINKYAVFERRRWRCPLCGNWTTLRERYAAPAARVRMPELSNPVYECFASMPSDGAAGRPPPRGERGPVYLALIDLAGSEEFVEMVKSGLLAALEGMPPTARVGIVTFSDRVGLYDAASPAPHVRYAAAGREGPPEVPLQDLFPPERALVALPAAKDALSFALDTLAPAPPPTPYAAGPPRRAFGSALLAALDFLAHARLAAPARLLCFLSGMPNYGPGALDPSRAARAAEQRAAGRREDALVWEATPFYREAGERAAALGAACDLFVVSREYVDLASLAPLAAATDGALRLCDLETTTLPQDLYRAVHDPCAWDGELRIRCSPEIRAGSSERPAAGRRARGVYGPLAPHPKYDQVHKIACCRPHTTAAFDLEFTSGRGFDGADRDPCIQMAFSYTELGPPAEDEGSSEPNSPAEGEARKGARRGPRLRRRLRVATLALSVAQDPFELYEAADAGATLAVLAHKSLEAAADAGVFEARRLLEDWLVYLTARYNAAVRALLGPAAGGSTYHPESIAHYGPVLSEKSVGTSRAAALAPLPRLVYLLLCDPLLMPARLPPPPRAATLPAPDGPAPRASPAADRHSPDALAARRHAVSSAPPAALVRLVRPALEGWASPDAPATGNLLLTREAMAASGAALFLLDAYDRAALYYPPLCPAPFPPPLESPLRRRLNDCRTGRSLPTQIRMIRAGALGAQDFDEEWMLDDPFAHGEDPAFPAPPRAGLAAFVAHVLNRTADYMRDGG